MKLIKDYPYSFILSEDQPHIVRMVYIFIFFYK